MSGEARPEFVRIREVGPRDGLQGERPVPVADRVRLVEALAATGLREIEAVAFVSERAVPAMAGASEVLAGLAGLGGVTLVALVPNRRGAEMALAAGAGGLNFMLSASEAYQRANVRRSVGASVNELAGVVELAGGVGVDVTVSCAFGSPYEGDVDPAEVAGLVERAREAGAGSVTLADTTGMATPRRVADVLAAVGTAVRLHLHETRGTALVNAYAALEAGVGDFDTSVGGLGGSPFAPGAAGNLATEGLVHLLDDLGVPTGISLGGLLGAAELAAGLVGHPVPSPVAAHGPRSRLASG